MKKLLLSAFLLLSGFTAAPAADLLNDAHDEHNAQYKQAFVGFGAGVDFSGQFTSLDVAGVFDGISADGIAGGLHGEYLFATGAFRVGPYIYGGLSDVNTQLAGIDVLQQDHYVGGGIKAGVVAFQTALVSVHAGYEWAGWSSDLPGAPDIDVTSFVLGGGVETMVTRNVSVGLTADYLIPDQIEAGGTDVTSALEDSEQLRVQARVTWRQ
jgi:opacity protein-like surface antigen